MDTDCFMYKLRPGRCGASRILHNSELNIPMVSYTVCMYKGLQLKSQHWNLNGGSMTALLPVLLPTSILPPCLYYFASFPCGKIQQVFQQYYYFICSPPPPHIVYVTFCKLNLHKSGLSVDFLLLGS